MAESGQNGAVSWNRYGYKFSGIGPYPRVTTIKGKKASGNALIDWAARMVAEEVARNVEAFLEQRIDERVLCTRLTDERLANAHNEKRDSAADFGTVFHRMVEAFAEGDQNVLTIAETELRIAVRDAFLRAEGITGKPEVAEKLLSAEQRDRLDAQVAAAHERLWPDVEAFLDWEDRTDIEWIRSEFQVFSEDPKYAGSVDAYVTINGVPLLLDVKTSKGAYPDYGLQLAAYRYAEFIGEPDGSQTPVPDVDGGVILHVHGGRCRLLEVPCGPEVFAAFRACADLYRFDREAPKQLPEWQPPLIRVPAPAPEFVL